MPGGQMIGPMLASSALHIAGITAAKPPVELIILSQVIIGANIGTTVTAQLIAAVLIVAITGAACSSGDIGSSEDDAIPATLVPTSGGPGLPRRGPTGTFGR